VSGDEARFDSGAYDLEGSLAHLRGEGSNVGMSAPAFLFARNRRPCREEDFVVHAVERGAPRRQLRLDCEVVRTRDFEPIGSKAVDLSGRGMQLLAENEAAHGDEVQVFFRVPFSSLRVYVEGVVTRVIAGMRSGDWGPAYGVRFGALPGHIETALRETLWRFPPTLAWRPRRIDYAASVRLIATS
jgi:hypothetical protein